MRNTYGKLMYLLMDAESALVKSELKINFVKPILTISKFLQQKEALNMISDPMFFKATVSIKTSKSEKNEIIKNLIEEYTSELLTEEDIRRVLDSVNDNESYKVFNVKNPYLITNILITIIPFIK
jgi:hypothetical protein